MLLSITDQFASSHVGGDLLNSKRNSLRDDTHLSQIRAQTSSSDPISRREAALLNAIESTISEVDRDLPPIAYLGLLLTLIEGNIAHESADSREQLILQLKLLCIILRKQKPLVLIAKVDVLVGLLMEILKRSYNDLSVLRMITRCTLRILERVELCKWPENSPRAILFKNMLLLAINSELESVIAHLKTFFNNILSNPEYNSVNPSSLKRDVYNWCDDNLTFQEKQLSDQHTSSITSNPLKTLDLIIVLCMPISCSKGYGNIEKRVGSMINIMKLYYSVSKNNVNEIYSIVSPARKLLTALDHKHFIGDYPSWCATSTKNILLLIIDIIEDTSNPGILAQYFNILLQALNTLHFVFKLSEDKKIIGSSDLKVFNNIGSFYLDTLITIFDKTLSKTYLASLKGNSGDNIEKMKECNHSILKGCILTSISNGNYYRLLDGLLSIVKKYLLGYTYSPIWGHIFDLLPALISKVRVSSDLVSLVRDIPLFKIFLSSFPDDLDTIRPNVQSCMVFLAKYLGLKLLMEAVFPSDTYPSGTEPRLRLSLYPKLIEIYIQALSELSKEGSIRQKSTPRPYSLGETVGVIIPEINALKEKINDNTKTYTTEEKIEFDRLRLDMWNLISKICDVLPVDCSESFMEIDKLVNCVILNNPKACFFYDSLYSDEYIKTAYRIYSSLVRNYFEGLQDASEEERKELKAKCTAVAKSAEDYIPVLCNKCIDVYTISHTSTDSLPKGSIAQKLHEGKDGLLRECVFWTAVMVDNEKVLDYLSLLLKTILNHVADRKNMPYKPSDPKDIKMYLMLGLIEILTKALNFTNTNSNQDSYYNKVFRLIYDTIMKLLPIYDSIEQKKMYSILNVIITKVEGLCTNSDFEILAEKSLLNSVTRGSKKNRIIILSKLITSIPWHEEDILLERCTKFLPELVLATKEKGVKVRKVAYHHLLELARYVCGVIDAEYTFREEYMRDTTLSASRFEKFIYILFAGLALDDKMKSATAISLIYVVSNFSSLVNDSFFRELFFTVSEFKRSDSLLLLKSYLVFIRTIVTSVSQDKIDSFLEHIVQGLLDVSYKKGYKLRNVILNIFDKIARKFSYEALEGFIPTNDSKLLASIRKRSKKYRNSTVNEFHEDEATSIGRAFTIRKSEITNKTSSKTLCSSKLGTARNRQVRSLRRNSDANSQDSSTSFDIKGTKGSYTTVLGDEGNEAINLLDIGTGNAFSEYSRLPISRSTKKSAKNYFEEDSSGKILITDDLDTCRGGQNPRDDMVVDNSDSDENFMECLPTQVPASNDYPKSLSRTNKPKSRSKSVKGDEISIMNSSKSWGQHQSKKTLRKASMRNREVYKITGKQYRSKRARGDIKKKGSKEPYAYINLRSNVVSSLSKVLKREKRRKS